MRGAVRGPAKAARRVRAAAVLLALAMLGCPERRPEVGGPFELVDASGRAVSDQTFRGRWLLVFFGFTACPDVCPTALADMHAVLEALGEDASRVQPLFISVDAQRDRPERLAAYTRAFDARILGLTGTPQQIERAARAYGVYQRRVAQGGGYTFDHSAVLYLMDPEGRYAAHFPPRTPPVEIAAALRARVGAGGPQDIQ
jgi:protein SCO1/2